MNFSVKRVWLLTRAKYCNPSPKIALHLLLMFAVVCLLTLCSHGSEDSIRTVGSVILVLYVIRKLHLWNIKQTAAAAWLTLPASIEEKWMADFFVTAVAVPALYLISLVFLPCN